jgi:regulator of RNase E activity RraB
VAQLQALGDDETATRKVDHTILLPLGADPSDLVSRLQAAGYAIDDVSVNAAETVVACSRLVDLTDQIAHVREVFDLAKRYGGTYDGWGAPVATS